MAEFRRLALCSILCGAIAGLVWFVAQYIMVVPLIQRAEVYEVAAQNNASDAPHEHPGQEWRPSEGFERNSLTLIATVLAGIGLTAIFFGTIAALGQTIDPGRGILWGLAGFACFSAAPALGLPPQPPGIELANLSDRQLWWTATVLLTSVGLVLLIGSSNRWYKRGFGVFLLILPHAFGAPASAGKSVVPAELSRHFTTASLGSAFLFWITLGIAGGFIFNRKATRSHSRFENGEDLL